MKKILLLCLLLLTSCHTNNVSGRGKLLESYYNVTYNRGSGDSACKYYVYINLQFDSGEYTYDKMYTIDISCVYQDSNEYRYGNEFYVYERDYVLIIYTNSY